MLITSKVNQQELGAVFSKMSGYIEAWNTRHPSPPPQVDLNAALEEMRAKLKEFGARVDLIGGEGIPSTEIDGIEVVVATRSSIYLNYVREFVDALSKEVNMLREARLLLDKVRTPPPSFLYVNGSAALLVVGRSIDVHFVQEEAVPEKPAELKPLPPPTGLNVEERLMIRKILDEELSKLESVSVRQVVTVDGDL